MSKRLLFSGLFFTSLALAVAGQSPGSTPPPTESRRESQPPEQSGQAQQQMKEARVELERAAIDLEVTEPDDEVVTTARDALNSFEQSLEQLHQSVPGYVPLKLATSLLDQVSSTLALLDSDLAAAATSMHELALRVTDLTAEADLLIGRPLIGISGEKLGDISNVLITAQGRVEALVVDRMEPSKDRQFAVEWSTVVIRGPNLIAPITEHEADKLPDYTAD